MDRNTTIGIVLIFFLLYMWAKMNAPTEAEMMEMQRLRDSITLAESGLRDSLAGMTSPPVTSVLEDNDTLEPDVKQNLQLEKDFGVFAPAASGVEEMVFLENEVLKVTVSTRGGRITSALVKPYKKLIENEEKEDVYLDLLLLEDPKNKFEYLLPVSTAPGGFIKSSDLYFVPNLSGNQLTLTATLGSGRSLKQIYTLGTSYGMDYQLTMEGLDRVLNPNDRKIKLNWVNYLDKIEKNTQYERIYSTVYYKEMGEDPNYCSQSGDDQEVLDESPVKWISHSNQFFSSTLVADNPFTAAVVETQMLDESLDDLKVLTSNIDIPYQGLQTEEIKMHWYIGPNEFELLQSYGDDMEDIAVGPWDWIFVYFGQALLGDAAAALDRLSAGRGMTASRCNFLDSTYVLARNLTSKGSPASCSEWTWNHAVAQLRTMTFGSDPKGQYNTQLDDLYGDNSYAKQVYDACKMH